jgi:hypothetical protein
MPPRVPKSVRRYVDWATAKPPKIKRSDPRPRMNLQYLLTTSFSPFHRSPPFLALPAVCL